MSKRTGKPVVVFTKEHGIYFGYASAAQLKLDGWPSVGAIKITHARHCRYYVCKTVDKGAYSLASAGPGSGSKIGPRVTMTVASLSKVVECTPAATEAWEGASW
jgi:hypothetical protein